MRKNDRSLINVLEEKCQFSSQNFSLPPLFHPFVPGGWKSPWCGLHGRLRPPQIWYNGHVFFLPTAFLLLQIAPLLSHFCPNPPSSPSRIFFVPSLLETYSTSFLFLSWKNIGGEIIARILREIIGGILEAKFFFFLPLSRNRIVWFEGKNIFFFLCDSPGEEE